MRLIDADELKKYVKTVEDYESAYTINGIIDNAPTVEQKYYERVIAQINPIIEARPKGEWIKHIDNLFPEESTEECPFCHEEQILTGNDDNFCPNCGADMRGKEE